VEVRQHGPDALSWKVLMAGKEKKWEARIIEQIPDTSIVWESVDGTSNRGAVTFEPLGTAATRLTLVMEYEPEGFLEKAGDLLGIPSGHVEESLNSFRELIESKGGATGGWRGRIKSTDLEKASVDKDRAPDPAMLSLDGFPASNEAETHRQTPPVTETGEHEVSMVARPNDTDQEVQNTRSIIGEKETLPVKAQTVGSVPAPTLQAVPVTELEEGEHEAGMVARASDKEGTRGVEPMESALDGLVPETAETDAPEGFSGNTFFEPGNEEIARRAYHLYLARDQVAGHEMEDWLEAKRQLLAENNLRE
jgi:Protein of unknown function (DUF2934)